MSQVFCHTYTIRYQDTDPNLQATWGTLLGCMQETAILHSEEVGRGIDWLTKRELSWVLVQTRARILRRPPWRSRIQIHTWPSEMGSMLSHREFEIFDEQHKLLMVATTLWALVDTKKRRATKIVEPVRSAYPVYTRRALDKPFKRPRPCSSNQWSLDFVIRRWQIDFNGHVNNLRYIEWMLETLPREAFEDCELQEINIRYQQEVELGQKVLAISHEEPQSREDSSRIFAHEIRLPEDRFPLAIAQSTWQPKKHSSAMSSAALKPSA